MTLATTRANLQRLVDEEPRRYIRGTPAGRFWPKVRKGPGCWEWQANRQPKGYGLFRMNGTMLLAHRVAWTLVNGPIPEGFHVLHHCDNPACVRLDHLYLGTDKDNARDREQRGRRVPAKGERHGHSVLTIEKVRAIRRLRDEGQTLRQIANHLGVSKSCVAHVAKRRSWREVP